jgi:alanyl-tRNA synthetase
LLNKETLRKDFSGDYRKYYSTALFESEGFERKKCSKCGKYFWTADSSREVCGDPDHEPYTFIKERPVEVDYVEFWRKFSKFFEDNGHEIIESYPVVSRWRQDLYFVIAGIQDFQRIENGKMSFEYGANPLLVPQMCMRFGDIPNVGVTGRHGTSFIMANQTAFNYPKEGYWRDRTIELNYQVMTKLLGIKKDQISYVEDVWAMGDFSEFGPDLETFSHGLEIVNNVFTQFEYSGGEVRELKGKVVDVGWGFERLPWFISGEQTMYDVIFRKELEYLYKSSGIKPDKKLYAKIAGVLGTVDVSERHSTAAEEKLVESIGIGRDDYLSTVKPMQAMYAIADHAKTLMFAVNDGALPSNVGGGYNLRVILRRAFDFIERYNLEFDMMKLIEIEARTLKGIYPHIEESLQETKEVIDVERERYAKTKREAKRIVDTLLSKGAEITKERLKTLYESNGITPDFISAAAKEKNVAIEIPEDAYSSIIAGDFAEQRKKEKKQIGIDTEGLAKTEKLYYSFASEAKARVLLAKDGMVILDRTPFYPEGGGQEADHGTIDGIEVTDVQSANGVIVHFVKDGKGFRQGKEVECKVDMERRRRLMAHHTATHLISAAARKVLGKHAWQEGARKGAEKAHIDIAHYERLSDRQVKEIEDTANAYITNGIKVRMKEMERSEAEGKFGFSIYQGHGVPSGTLRIVEVDDLKGKLIDAEACGGLHLEGMESTIGLIKITASYRIHDGIDRLEFVAGKAAADYINGMESSIKRIAQLAGTDADKVGSGIEAKIEEMKGVRQQYEKLRRELAASVAYRIAESKDSVIIAKLDYERSMLREIATLVVESDGSRSVLLYNGENEAVAISGAKSGRSAVSLLEENAKKIGGARAKLKGGGSERIAEGRISD